MKVTREFCPADRYRYDFGPCSPAHGWAQVDSQQDAPYYGMWANPTAFKVFCYCEGDTTLIECDGPEEFNSYIRETIKWIDEAGYGPGKIDGMCRPDIIAAFHSVGLADLLH